MTSPMIFMDIIQSNKNTQTECPTQIKKSIQYIYDRKQKIYTEPVLISVGGVFLTVLRKVLRR